MSVVLSDERADHDQGGGPLGPDSRDLGHLDAPRVRGRAGARRVAAIDSALDNLEACTAQTIRLRNICIECGFGDFRCEMEEDLASLAAILLRACLVTDGARRRRASELLRAVREALG
jgi:hypothetical protein